VARDDRGAGHVLAMGADHEGAGARTAGFHDPPGFLVREHPKSWRIMRRRRPGPAAIMAAAWRQRVLARRRALGPGTEGAEWPAVMEGLGDVGFRSLTAEWGGGVAGKQTCDGMR
jgi:hypothetical protein